MGWAGRAYLQAWWVGPPGILAGPSVSKVGPPGMGRGPPEARRPARFALGSPLALCFRFSDANPGPGDFGVGVPAAGTVRARLPASPLFSVFGREPRAEDFGVGGPAAAMVRARLPAFGFRARTSGRGFRGWRPGGHHGSRSSPRFRFSGANLGPGISGLEARRFFPGAVCSPLPASPFGSVSGSKIFTHFPHRLLPPAAVSEARFAPRSLLALAAPFRGAKSSHNFRADAGGRRIKKHLVGLSGKVLSSLPQFACGQRSCPQVFPAILPQGHAISRECFHLIK